MKIWITLFSFLVFANSCKQRTQETDKKTVSSDTANFYPIAPFLQEQIEETDLNNLPRKCTHIKNQEKRTVNLSRDSFLLLTKNFQVPINVFTTQKHFYKESILQDLSTQSYTLSYRTINPSCSALEYLDILLNDKTKKVRRIEMQLTYERDSITTTEHLSWKTNKGFIISSKQSNTKGKTQTEIWEVDWEQGKKSAL
ncbi:MAG: hypothetical protein EBX50_07625 [Chitinophagia bacterium]|nr:hypothetical protein [Chitinophagia bacterium]